MRVSGPFSRLDDLLGPEKRHQTDGLARESVDPALLPIHHADGRRALETLPTQSLDGARRGIAARHDVLDETHLLAGPIGPFHAARRSVLLLLVPDDQE